MELCRKYQSVVQIVQVLILIVVCRGGLFACR